MFLLLFPSLLGEENMCVYVCYTPYIALAINTTKDICMQCAVDVYNYYSMFLLLFFIFSSTALLATIAWICIQLCTYYISYNTRPLLHRYNYMLREMCAIAIAAHCTNMY